jgi:hypothetical protein
VSGGAGKKVARRAMQRLVWEPRLSGFTLYALQLPFGVWRSVVLVVWYLVSGVCCLVLGTRCVESGVWCATPCNASSGSPACQRVGFTVYSRGLVFGVRCSVFGVWGLGFGAWCLVVGGWCLVCGAWWLVFGGWCLVVGVWCRVCRVCAVQRLVR